MIDVGRRLGRRWPAEKNERRALVLDAPALRPLSTLPAPYQRIVVDWNEMIAAVRHEPPSSVAIIDPVAGDSLDGRVRELVAAAGLVPVLAVIPLDLAHAERIKPLYDGGVADVADAAFECTPTAILARLREVHAMPFKQRLEPHLSRFVSMEALILIRAAAGVVVDRGAATDLARFFASNERTVAGWCVRAGLPPPRRLFAWLRLLLAMALLEPPGRTIADAARCAGYRDQSLRRATRELLGAGVRPRRGLFATAAAAFNDELRECRERIREARRGTPAA